MFGIDQLATKIAAAFVALVVVFSFGYFKGHAAVQVKFDQFKAEVAAASELQTQKTNEINAKNRHLVQETKDAYNTQLANLRSYYQLRLNKGGSTLPTVPFPAAGIAGYSPDNLPPTSVLASQCAETTLTLISLQNWAVNVQKTYQ